MSREISEFRPSSLGAIRTKRSWSAPSSARDGARDLRPLVSRASDDAAGVAEKLGACIFAVKEIKPLAAHGPKQRMTRHRLTARDRHRVIAAEGRRIDVRMLGERRSIPFVAEAPYGAVCVQFEFRAAEQRLAVGEIGNR